MRIPIVTTIVYLTVVALGMGTAAIAGDIPKGIAELQLMYPQELAQEAAAACLQAQVHASVAQLYRSRPYRNGHQEVARLEQRLRQLEYLDRVGLVARAQLRRDPTWLQAVQAEARREFADAQSLRQGTRCFDLADGVKRPSDLPARAGDHR